MDTPWLVGAVAPSRDADTPEQLAADLEAAGWTVRYVRYIDDRGRYVAGPTTRWAIDAEVAADDKPSVLEASLTRLLGRTVSVRRMARTG